MNLKTCLLCTTALHTIALCALMVAPVSAYAEGGAGDATVGAAQSCACGTGANKWDERSGGGSFSGPNDRYFFYTRFSSYSVTAWLQQDVKDTAARADAYRSGYRNEGFGYANQPTGAQVAASGAAGQRGGRGGR